jgi:hypothetical protein
MTRYVPGYMPYTEGPTLAECEWDEAQNEPLPAPDTRLCLAGWISHNREQWEACPYCQGDRPLCSFAGRDRCQHHRFVDDPGVRWDPVAKRHYCDVLEAA